LRQQRRKSAVVGAKQPFRPRSAAGFLLAYLIVIDLAFCSLSGA